MGSPGFAACLCHLAGTKSGGAEAEANRGLLQIVDTVLLQCYLETSELLVASLLRLRDNACNVPVSEKLLRRSLALPSSLSSVTETG